MVRWAVVVCTANKRTALYNDHVESTCYHPLLLFNREGDSVAAKLRPGNGHSAEDWEERLLPEIERQKAGGRCLPSAAAQRPTM
jgi:hypothetical protein